MSLDRARAGHDQASEQGLIPVRIGAWASRAGKARHGTRSKLPHPSITTPPRKSCTTAPHAAGQAHSQAGYPRQQKGPQRGPTRSGRVLPASRSWWTGNYIFTRLSPPPHRGWANSPGLGFFSRQLVHPSSTAGSEISFICPRTETQRSGLRSIGTLTPTLTPTHTTHTQPTRLATNSKPTLHKLNFLF